MSNIQHMIGLIASGLSVAALIIILMGFHILPIVVVVVATLLCPGHVTWRDRGLMCHAVARYNGGHHRLPS